MIHSRYSSSLGSTSFPSLYISASLYCAETTPDWAWSYMTSKDSDIVFEYLAHTIFGFPSATIFPFSIQMARVHSSVTADMLWDTKTTVLPCLMMFLNAVPAFAEKLASPVLRTSSTSMTSALT